MLLGKRQDAHAIASDLWNKNPTLFRAYSIAIQSSSSSFEEIVGQVPEYCRSNPEVACALAFVASGAGNLEQAEHWCRIGIENDKDNWPDLRAFLAQTLLQRLVGNKTSPVNLGEVSAANRRAFSGGDSTLHRGIEYRYRNSRTLPTGGVAYQSRSCPPVSRSGRPRLPWISTGPSRSHQKTPVQNTFVRCLLTMQATTPMRMPWQVPSVHRRASPSFLSTSLTYWNGGRESMRRSPTCERRSRHHSPRPSFLL